MPEGEIPDPINDLNAVENHERMSAQIDQGLRVPGDAETEGPKTMGEVKKGVFAQHISQESIQKRREGTVNDDRTFSIIGEQSVLFGVADGMGGHDKGDQASKRAEDAVASAADNKQVDSIISTQASQDFVTEAIRRAQEAVVQLSPDQDKKHPGTTLVLGHYFEDESTGKQKVTLGQVGDSRLIMYSPESQTIEQLTLDHKMMIQDIEHDDEKLRNASLKDQQAIAQAEDRESLTDRQKVLSNSAFQAIDNYIGNPQGLKRISVNTIDVKPGEIMIAHTDGLNNLTESQMIEIIEQGGDIAGNLSRKAREMADNPNNSSFRKVDDDISATVFEIPETDKKGTKRENINVSLDSLRDENGSESQEDGEDIHEYQYLLDLIEGKKPGEKLVIPMGIYDENGNRIGEKPEVFYPTSDTKGIFVLPGADRVNYLTDSQGKVNLKGEVADNKLMQKKSKALEHVARYNPDINRIAAATTFEELDALLDNYEGFVTSSGDFIPSQGESGLKSRIGLLRNGSILKNRITNEYGLRTKVLELMKDQTEIG